MCACQTENMCVHEEQRESVWFVYMSNMCVHEEQRERCGLCTGMYTDVHRVCIVHLCEFEKECICVCVRLKRVYLCMCEFEKECIYLCMCEIEKSVFVYV